MKNRFFIFNFFEDIFFSLLFQINPSPPPPPLNIKWSVPNHFQKLSEAKPTSKTESDYNIILDDKGVPIEADYSDENDISNLNKEVTNEEVTYAISKLKLNKSCVIDELSNEYLKSSTPYMTALYTNLFNLILHTGVIPEIWTESIIKPIIYKQKGDRNNLDNYRGISLISCFSKLFNYFSA